MSRDPRAEPPEGPPMAPWKKAILVALALLPVGVLAYSMIFMVQNEAAFDESTCPYAEVELRVVSAGVSVREEGRTCQPGVEEHRWVLLREGEPEEPIGLRRLDAALYEHYSWTATIQEDDRVRLEITNGDEEDPRVFHEPHDDAGRR